MDKKQMEMLSVKSAVERVVQGFITSHQTSGGDDEVLFQQINETLHAFVASRQLKDFKFPPTQRVRSLEVWIQDYNDNGCTLTFMLPPRQPLSFSINKEMDKYKLNDIGVAAKEADVLIPAKRFAMKQYLGIDSAEKSEEEVSWPFPTGRRSLEEDESLDLEAESLDPTPMPRNTTPKINFIKDRKDLQDAAREEDPIDTYDRVKKQFS